MKFTSIPESIDCSKCPIYKELKEKLLEEFDSVIDAALTMDSKLEECYNTKCPKRNC